MITDPFDADVKIAPSGKLAASVFILDDHGRPTSDRPIGWADPADIITSFKDSA